MFYHVENYSFRHVSLSAGGVMIVGHRPYGALLQALAQDAPELSPTQQAEDEEKYKAYWGGALPGGKSRSADNRKSSTGHA
ncbi:hypothetical protein [Pontibacter akesuensis]|uniref:Uncharacterized protein n=1 Tax=Pontibacter akesuensis TaxID=388950 RepID=A0A1I7KNM2_9BACT|nr:hypothetical protein [Pontibacter akesuensis]GHA81917.1 hypothetical protein GCM10007389_40690 [Pontibacter akesuensis]SFU99043.1 hypothetical protein SAMN04487941_3911 [Pontibacter akesuensis]